MAQHRSRAGKRPSFPTISSLRSVITLLLLVVCATWTPVALHAEANQPGATLTLEPVQDVYVDRGMEDTNFNTIGALRVQAVSALNSIRQFALVEFDLATLPDGALIRRATLQLTQRAASGDALTIDVNPILSPWDEGKVTWNTLPDVESSEISAASPAAADLVVAWDVTTLVRQWHAAPLFAEAAGHWRPAAPLWERASRPLALPSRCSRMAGETPAATNRPRSFDEVIRRFRGR